jgi:putative ABC transport system ATP-binding protein
MFRSSLRPRFLYQCKQQRFLFSPKNKQKSLFQQLKPFAKFSKSEYKLIGGSIILLLISSSVTMSVPFSMGAIIDIVLEKMEGPEVETSKPKETDSLLKKLLQTTGSLTGLFALLGGVFIIGAAANAGRQILMTSATERVITRLRNSLFSNIVKQDISFHDKNRSGELISRLSTDTVVVGRVLTSNIADGLRGLVMSVTGVGAMLYVNVDLTMTIMVIVPVVSVGSVLYGQFVRKLSKQTTDASAELTKFAEEKLSNIRTVRAFSQERNEVEQYKQRSEFVYDLGMRQGYASALFFSSMGFSGNMIILAILYYGGSLVQQGVVSIGELTSFFLYTIYVGSSLISLSTWFSDLNKGAGAGERMFQLLESKPTLESQGN